MFCFVQLAPAEEDIPALNKSLVLEHRWSDIDFLLHTLGKGFTVYKSVDCPLYKERTRASFKQANILVNDSS